MAHFDLNEQERIDSLRYYWRIWGKYILTLVAVLIIAYIGSSFYQWYGKDHAEKAAVLYADFTTALNDKNNQKAIASANKLIETLPNTEYTPMAALQAAKLAVDQKDYSTAIKFLNWTKDSAKDKSMQSIAILRLAAIYVDQGKFDKARELLRTKHDLAFDGLFYEARGDMYIAMGDTNKARDAYKEGLQKAANDPSTQQVIQMKLDILGS